MTAFLLKIIAVITMTIDHVGHILFPDILFLRMIGRLAFPIFAFFVAEGAFRTKNLNRYTLRMFLFAVVTGLPADFALNGRLTIFSTSNVMWTFAFALLSILLCRKLDQQEMTWTFWAMAVPFVMLAEYFNTDYAGMGVVVVLIFYYFREKPVVKYGLAGALMFYQGISTTMRFQYFEIRYFIQVLAILSFPLLMSYQGEKGKSSKFWQYFFYVYYPLHLLVLGMIATYMGKM